ncbi:MAG: hypothetical protein H6965_16235 [Chromatiaceae bacterium]|nr:hypothetical protein [Chromatiaceae bacterium]
MEVSGISTTAVSWASQSTAQATVQMTNEESAAPTRRNEGKHEHGHHHGLGGRRGRALGVFHQELRTALRALFERPSREPSAYFAHQDEPSVDAVANEALATAKRATAEAPAHATKMLENFRGAVHLAASHTRTMVTAEDSTADVDAAVAQVDAGLDTLVAQAANNRESSASVLAVDTRTKQRSSISIQTQEGDLVTIDLRRIDTLSATTVALNDGDTSAAATSLELSSRSRLQLHIEGDLNDAELGAIRNVLAQAEDIASWYFGTDSAAEGAFETAANFDFDSDQLARVDMRMRMQQRVSLTYLEVRNTMSASSEAEALPPANLASNGALTASLESEANSESPTAIAPADSIVNNVDFMSQFRHSVQEGFAGNENGLAVRFHYSESFKLDLFRAVVHAVTPEESSVTTTGNAVQSEDTGTSGSTALAA